MNLRLARVFMRGVGPSSARFDPLLVDLRNAAGTADHAVLWLRNGGGKTTFERLVFHVLAWNDAKNIGKEEKARPGGIEYLLAAWQREPTPQRRRELIAKAKSFMPF